MTTLFERNEDRVTGFLRWTDFNLGQSKYHALEKGSFTNKIVDEKILEKEEWQQMPENQAQDEEGPSS